MDLDLRLLAIADLGVIPRDRVIPLTLAAARGGATMVQLRAKSASSGELLVCAEELELGLSPLGVPLTINDRVDVAILSGARGVHLGDEDLDPESARRLLGFERWIGRTARTPEAALAAGAEGADYLGVGSVYGGGSKPGVPIIGLEGLARIVRTSPVPVVAIGGISLETAADCCAVGAAGVAVIGALFAGEPSPEDVEERASRLRRAVARGCHRRERPS